MSVARIPWTETSREAVRRPGLSTGALEATGDRGEGGEIKWLEEGLTTLLDEGGDDVAASVVNEDLAVAHLRYRLSWFCRLLVYKDWLVSYAFLPLQVVEEEEMEEAMRKNKRLYSYK